MSRSPASIVIVYSDNGSRLSLLVTTLNVLLGAGLVAQCLAQYTERVCDLKDQWQAQFLLERELARSGTGPRGSRRRPLLDARRA